MVTLDKLPAHIKTARKKMAEAAKKVEDPEKNPDVRALKKKVKRLVRKAAKMEYAVKKAEENKKSKKEKK
ncbi:MAG: hypothetical protein ACE5GQ_00820 [Nitrospinales bacterium]